MKPNILLSLISLFCLAAFTAATQTPTGNSSPISFSYTLTNAARTSAAVYKNDGVDDILVRTLWSGQQKNAGTSTALWDGKDDKGNVVVNGAYKVKVLSNNVVYKWEGVVGNTSISSSGAGVHHAMQPITNMVQVGTNMYYAAGYNEGGHTHAKFEIGHPNVARTTLKGPGKCIRYMASDGVRIYNGGQAHGDLFFVSALTPNPSGTDALYTFPLGESVNIGRIYNAISKASGPITGLAVQTTGNYLFVARASRNELKVFHKITGKLLKTLFLADVREIKLQYDNTLWAIVNTNKVSKYTVNSDGTISTATRTLSGLINPLTLAVSPNGTELAVADRGTYHQVKIYNPTTGVLTRTLGRAESYTNTKVYEDKFYFHNTKMFFESNTTQYGSAYCFLAYQLDGSLWVGDYGNRRSQHFAANGSYIDNIQYMGYSYSSRTDINNPARVFSDYLEFEIDYSKPLAPNNGSWKFVRNWSKNNTLNDQYDRMWSVITLNNGRTYALYTIDGGGSAREVIELVPETGIRRTGVFLDNVDSELNSDGSQWQIGDNHVGKPTFWKRKPLTGFDGNNNPIWGAKVTLETTAPITIDDPLTHNGYLTRNHQTSTGIIAAFNASSYAGHLGTGLGWHLGGVKNGKWIFKTSPSTHLDYVGEYPVDGYFDIGNGVRNSGSFMQTIDRNIFWGYRGEFWKGSQTNKYNHYYDNGLFIGQFGVSGDVVRYSGTEAYPGYAGNALSGTYVKVGNDIYFYHCDESHHGGVHRWKISGLNTINETVVSITKNGTPIAPLEYIDLMAGLPYQRTLGNNTNGWSRNISPDYNNGYANEVSIRTSRLTYRKGDMDILLVNMPVTNGKTVWVKRDLGINTLSSWKITGEIAFYEESQNGDDWLDVLDDKDRVIARIERKDAHPIANVRGSGINIHSEAKQTFGYIVTNLQSFSFTVSGDSITIKYGNYNPVVTTVFDRLADVRKPKTLRLQTYSSNNAGHKVSIANLRFYRPVLFRSAANGNWKNTASWQTSMDNIVWAGAVVVPDHTAGTITIQKDHNITLSDSLFVDELQVKENGKLIIGSKATLFVNNGAGTDITIAPSSTMIIKSDSSGTGRIGNSSGSITGNVTVERYISSYQNKALRLLAPSVTTTLGTKPFIRDNWQEGQNNITGFGIKINGAGAAANGFDYSASSQASIFKFDQASIVQKWQPVLNTNFTGLDARKGYLVFVGGDRRIDPNIAGLSTNTTLQASGSVLTGTQVFTGLEGGGRWSLVTNPYPCAIDWKKIYEDSTTSNAANFENFYTFWDPNVSKEGGFATVNVNGIKNAINNANTEIQSGQSFFIRAKAGTVAPVFTIKESYKTGNDNAQVLREGPAEQLMSSLYYYEPDGSRVMSDAVNNVFDNDYSATVDGDDAREMTNWEENIGIARDGKILSIEMRPLVSTRDSIPLHITGLTARPYEWQFEPLGFINPSFVAYLQDKYLNSRSMLSLSAPTVLGFTINSDSASFASDRFTIYFGPLTVMDVSFLSIEAQKFAGNVRVRWNCLDDVEVARYEIERSGTGQSFHQIGMVGSNRYSGNSQYEFIDANPATGQNYYRIRLQDYDGEIKYSKIIMINFDQQVASFEVFPNPMQNNELNTRFIGVPKGIYTLSLSNGLGQVVYRTNINHAGGSGLQSSQLGDRLPSGSYNLQIKGENISIYKTIVK